MLGLAAAGVILWYLLPRGAPAPEAKRDDIDAALTAAQTQLAAARVTGKGALAGLPMVLVVGAEGSAKTTSVIRSGLEPELLAGNVMRGETVAPTANVNVWYAQGTIFLEAGGAVSRDASRFARIVRRAQPRRLAAVLGRGGQAPRVALVCVSCDDLLRPGSSESALTLARTLRERLSELARGLGIRLPVYVLFTKADRIPYFAEYVQNFTTDDARQVLGVTLPADDGPPGLYTDRQSKRLTDALQQIFRGLADQRLNVLARENAPERKPGAYEFPRELRKLIPVVTQFLVELTKPSQLQVSPFLRGAYFTGVRAVFITDVAPAVAPQAPLAARAPSGGAIAATGVFQAGQLGAAAAAGPAMAATPSVRKVPQWLFLNRVFTDVLLADRAAMGVTSGGARVNVLRRMVLAGATAAALLLAVALTVSYAGNKRIERETLATARLAAALPASTGGLPSLDALQRLDSLRVQVQRLSAWEHDGPPLHLRWGLYAGSRLYPAARRIYFAGFDRLLLADTRAALSGALTALPAVPQPTDDYGTSYALLKAYLITTTNAEKSTEEFLTPVLQAQWVAARQPDSARAPIAQRQFALYANELRYGNPYTVVADPTLVQHARSFLQQFSGSEPIYQAMLAEAARGNAAVEFNKQVPGTANYVVDRYAVPAAFTTAGYAAMQRALEHADRFFQGEPWVLGGEPPSQVDRAKVIAQLRERYRSDYIAAWRSFLQNATIVRYSGVKDAAARLGQLAGNQSALLALLATASRNTALDSAGIGAAMQPVHAVIPPATPMDKLITPVVQPYVTALANLQAALDQVASAPPGGADAQIATAGQNAGMAKVEAQKIAQQFQVTDAGVAAAVQRLLSDPITSVEPFLRNYGAGQLNGQGAGFCAQAASVLRKFPFDPDATAQASLAEVTAVFHPLNGSLWKFYNSSLQNVLVKNGNDYAPKPGGTLTITPSFLSFFNRAAAVTAALFPQSAGDPHFTYALQPAVFPAKGDLTVTMDRETVEYSRQARQHTFTWNGAPTSEATIAIKNGATRTVVASYRGPWALFQLFDAAASSQASGNAYRTEWNTPGGGRVGLDLDMGTLPPIVRKGYFTGFRCTGVVVR